MGVRRLTDGGGDFVLEAPDGLRPASLYLEEASVTGTETALLAAAAAPGTSEIRHAACEPHVAELCRFLTRMGAEVEGAGTSTLRIAGGRRLAGVEHRLGGDYIEAGSWAVAAAVTGGEIDVHGAAAGDLEPITAVLRRMGIDCDVDDERLRLRPSRPEAVRQITTAPWPGFPSDMVSLICVLATQARGATLVHDWMYELRLFALEQLSGMSANLFLCDPHRMIVNGPAALTGRTLDSRDLRSGMALIAAALAATGTSRIHPLETVERGYAQLVERVARLGRPHRCRRPVTAGGVARIGGHPPAPGAGALGRPRIRGTPARSRPGSAWRDPRRLPRSRIIAGPGGSHGSAARRRGSPRLERRGEVWAGPATGRSPGAGRAPPPAAAPGRGGSAPVRSCSG